MVDTCGTYVPALMMFKVGIVLELKGAAVLVRLMFDIASARLSRVDASFLVEKRLRDCGMQASTSYLTTILRPLKS